jgi:hypothetical protein
MHEKIDPMTPRNKDWSRSGAGSVDTVQSSTESSDISYESTVTTSSSRSDNFQNAILDELPIASHNFGPPLEATSLATAASIPSHLLEVSQRHSSSQDTKSMLSDEELPAHVSAFEYAIAPYLEKGPVESGIDVSILSDAPTNTRWDTSSTLRSSELEPSNLRSTLSQSTNHLPQFFKDSTLDIRVCYLTLNTVLMRCSILSQSDVAGNFITIRKLAKQHAVPLAETLGLSDLQGRAWYWAGRGEAALGNWRTAKEDFERVVAYGLGDRKEEADGLDIRWWVDEMQEQIDISEQEAERSSAGHTKLSEPRMKAQRPTGLMQKYLRATDFTAEELRYITATPDVAPDLERRQKKSAWLMTQRKQLDWLLLYQSLDNQD